MIHRNICPICGSENPVGAEICQVCKANLSTLPDEMFPADIPQSNTQLTTENTAAQNDHEIDLDSTVPAWLQKRFQQKDKQEQSAFDFDAYTNALFGMPNKGDNAVPTHFTKPQKPQKAESVYQPFLENLIEPPLLEPDENSPKTITENVPGIADFKIRRPAKKWDDRLPDGSKSTNKGSSIDLLHDFETERPARKWDDQNTEADYTLQYDENGMLSLPSWWKDDAPLVETDGSETEEKGSDTDEQELLNSVSPTKVIDAEKVFSTTDTPEEKDKHSSFPRYQIDEYEPESGSLLSELMNEMNSPSESLTPGERQEKENGTVFYSGNHPDNTEAPEQETESEVIEINPAEDGNASNAAMLDQILRGIGYQVEGEPQPVSPSENSEKDQVKQGTRAEGKKQKPLVLTNRQETTENKVPEVIVPQVIENPLLIPDNDEEDGFGEKDAGFYDYDDEEKIPSRDDYSADLDIPWDLFGAAEMALPQSPEDPEYRTFSRSGIPDEAEASAYQQRMISSILGKIIHAENFVEPKQEKNERFISLQSRLFWTLLSVCGIILILLTGVVDHLIPESIHSDDLTASFYQAVESAGENVLVVADYAPAYGSLMDDASNKLFTALEENTEKIYLAVLNPSAMPFAQRILNKNSEKIVFAGWWPSGLISIRTRIAFGNLPEQIWLLTSETGSVQNWAEQLAVSDGKHKLHVIAPGQLSPFLKTYLNAGMVSSALCSDFDLQHYGLNEYTADRSLMAVWYLTALVPISWLAGTLMKFFKTKPNYERTVILKPEDEMQDAEKEKNNG